MNKKIAAALLIGVCWLCTSPLRAFQAQSQAQPQACADDETVVTGVKQDLGDTVSTVKKETLDDFQKEFHQQASISKLSICLGVVNDLLSCLDKATHDPAITKTQLNEIKAKQSSYAKLKDTINQDLQSLKAAKQPATAKAEIEKFDFTH